MLKIGLVLLLTLPTLVFGACDQYWKIHGLVNLKKKTWETTHVNKKSEEVCNALPLPANPNIEIKVVKGEQIFTTRIFRPLVGFWDKEGKDHKLSGGTFEIDLLPVDSFMPIWYQGSVMTITEISSKQKIAETRL